jgi:hypothetical protein
MDHLTEEMRQSLIYDIASRQYTVADLTEDYECTRAELQQFLADNLALIERERAEHFPDLVENDSLWIANKPERLKRYQDVADKLYESITLEGPSDAVTLRELRAYMLAAANELGQLLHRGSGDTASGDLLNVEFTGVDVDTLR